MRHSNCLDFFFTFNMTVNPSYWISDYELDNPKISTSTPNLSDWSSPHLSRPSRTFFSPLERVAEETDSCSDLEARHGGMVSSKSMAPIAVNVRSAPKIRKSVSYSDLEHRPFSPKNASVSKAERRRPPSPPKKDFLSSTEDRSASLSDNSPNLFSDDSHKSSSKESSSGDTHKPLCEEKPKPLPRRKKDTDPLPKKKRRSSLDNDYDSLVPDYINVEKFAPATMPADPSPLYQELNPRLLDKPAQYATLAEVRKK